MQSANRIGAMRERRPLTTNVLEALREYGGQEDEWGHSLGDVQFVERRHETSNEIVVQGVRDWSTLEWSWGEVDGVDVRRVVVAVSTALRTESEYIAAQVRTLGSLPK